MDERIKSAKMLLAVEPKAEWRDVTLLQNTDKVQAWLSPTTLGASNVPIVDLRDRTEYLKTSIEALPASKEEVEAGIIDNKFVSPATLPKVTSVPVGTFSFYMLSASTLANTGWYVCDGSKYDLSSPVGRVLQSFSQEDKTRLNIVEADGRINIPDLTTTSADNDGGRYIRCGVDGKQGTLQNDTIRNITGKSGMWRVARGGGGFEVSDGCFAPRQGVAWYGDASSGGDSRPSGYALFDASRVVPTSKENRPTSITLLPIIFLGV